MYLSKPDSFAIFHQHGRSTSWNEPKDLQRGHDVTRVLLIIENTTYTTEITLEAKSTNPYVWEWDSRFLLLPLLSGSAADSFQPTWCPSFNDYNNIIWDNSLSGLYLALATFRAIGISWQGQGANWQSSHLLVIYFLFMHSHIHSTVTGIYISRSSPFSMKKLSFSENLLKYNMETKQNKIDNESVT